MEVLQKERPNPRKKKKMKRVSNQRKNGYPDECKKYCWCVVIGLRICDIITAPNKPLIICIVIPLTLMMVYTYPNFSEWGGAPVPPLRSSSS